MKHTVTLDAELIARVWKWATSELDAGRLHNCYTTRGAETNPLLQTKSKLAEFAFAKWVGLDESVVTLQSIADDGGDVTVGVCRVDIKSIEMWKRLLLWPASKVATYDRKNFTHLVLVKHEDFDFKMSGWISKQRFRDEHETAIENNPLRLDVGTWTMHESRLGDMDIFFSLTGQKGATK